MENDIIKQLEEDKVSLTKEKDKTIAQLNYIIGQLEYIEKLYAKYNAEDVIS